MKAASTSNANTPYITGRHSPAARRRASTRRQEPGASTAQPMRRPAPPARKMAVSSGAPETLDVLYVNTRQEDSLRVISEQSSGDADQRPVKGF